MELSFFIAFWPPRTLWLVQVPAVATEPAPLGEGGNNMLLSAILLKGTLAARPAANTLGEGVLYAATDNGIIYQVQSAAWVTWYPAPAGTGTVTNVATGTGLTGGPISTTGTIAIADTAVTPGTYGDSANVGVFTVDAQGRITAASEAAISGGGGTPGGSDKNLQYNNAGAFGGIANNASATKKYLQQLSSGTPTLEQVSGADLVAASVGPTQLANTAVTPGTYGDSANVPVVTVDAQGRITAASEAAISGGGGGALQLIEHKLITSAQTTVTFSGLDGDADGVYLLISRVRNATANNVAILLQPNGITANQTWAYQQGSNGGGSQGGGATGALVVTNMAGPNKSMFAKTTIHARKVSSGQPMPRFVMSHAACWDNIPRFYVQTTSGEWNDTTTNINSLDIVSSTANSISAGSMFTLYKYKET